MKRTRIEWADSVWNPTSGCTPVSPGCEHCYAARMARRLQAMGLPEYRYGFDATAHPHRLGLPASWRRPSWVFVDSMGDLLHERIDDGYLAQVIAAADRAPWHRFLSLTKRPERLSRIVDVRLDANHLWWGVSIEAPEQLHRLESLKFAPVAHRFLSLEPLLAPLPDLDLEGIEWVIAGGENGPGARPCNPAWILDIAKQCATAKVPFFFKGLGSRQPRIVVGWPSWCERPA